MTTEGVSVKQGFNGKYRFLSNFYPSPVEFEGMKYPTVEHAYQAAKTTDTQLREFIAKKNTPGEAKVSGRNLPIRADWEDIKLSIMRTLLRKKFYDPALKAALHQTKDEELVEVTYWHDTFWGICTCNLHAGNGDNHLGKLLMEIRSKIIAGDQEP